MKRLPPVCLGMAGPMLATWLVTLCGGVTTGGIRPLFFSGLILTIVTFVVVLTQLSERKWAQGGKPADLTFNGTLHRCLAAARI